MILTTMISTTIEKAEVIEFYKTLLENQSSNFSTLINFFLAISGILITASLAYNYFIAKNQIKKEVENEVKKIEENLKVKYDIYLKEEVEKVEALLDDKLLYNEATILTTLAMQCMGSGNYDNGISFYFQALSKYIELNNEFLIRHVVDNINNTMSNQLFFEKFSSEKWDYDEIIKIINYIPDILSIEKENILNKLNILKARI